METADTPPHARPTDRATTADAAPDTVPVPHIGLELLVHGVGGTTPEKMLGDPRVQRITGDDTAACYRRTEDANAEERPGDHLSEPVREAYCWSNLTSGNGARALWLILVPFMVANLAHWMRPAAPPEHRAQRIYDLLVRLLALTLTVLLAAAACEVALDLTAWQCAGTPGCVVGKSWLGFLSPDNAGWWSVPGRRLALASVVPLMVVGFLWWLSHRTWSAYESASPPPRPPGASRDTPAEERTALNLNGFWYGRRLVARLRAAHTTAGVLTIAAALLVASRRTDRQAGDGTLVALGQGLTALVVLLAAGTLIVVWRTARSEAAPDDGADHPAVRALPYAALAVLALTAVHAGWARPGARSHGPLPGVAAFGEIAVLQGVLVLALAVTAWFLQRAARDEARTALRGMGGPAVALLACAVGGVLSGGVAVRFADWIGGPAAPDRGHAPIPGPPVLLSWQASVIPALLVVVAVVAVLAGIRVIVVRNRVAEDVPGLYDPRERPDALRARRIAGTIARAGLTDAAPVLVAATAAVTLTLGAGAVAGAWITGQTPGRATAGAAPVLHAAAETAESLGSWLMGAGVVLLLTMGRRAYRDHSARRTIGILWDVGTFWPRAAHPFAPPCYAERAVPDLTWRMATWTERFDGRLVISGHSQGSVLAAAAVWQLDPVTRSRVALLTYGSPLERLYGRWFPAFFGPPALTGLHREMDDWRNLWRFTDPIGGPIRLTCEDGRRIDEGPLRDPLAFGRTLQNPLPAQILGHGDYQADPVFDKVRAELIARLGPAIPCPRAERAPAHGSSGRSSA